MVIFHRFLLPFTRPGNPQNPWGLWNPGSPTGGLWKINHHILGKHILKGAIPGISASIYSHNILIILYIYTVYMYRASHLPTFGG